MDSSSDSDISEGFLTEICNTVEKASKEDEEVRFPIRADQDTSSAAKSDGDGGQTRKIVFGDSVREWRANKRRNPSSFGTTGKQPNKRQNDATLILVKTDLPLAKLTGSHLTVSKTQVKLSTLDKEEYAGHLHSSAMDPSPAFTDCVATFDHQRRCFVLEVVDCTVSNLMLAGASTNNKSHPVSENPLVASRKAEAKLKKRRAAAKRKAPTPSKKPKTGVEL